MNCIKCTTPNASTEILCGVYAANLCADCRNEWHEVIRTNTSWIELQALGIIKAIHIRVGCNWQEARELIKEKIRLEYDIYQEAEKFMNGE